MSEALKRLTSSEMIQAWIVAISGIAPPYPPLRPDDCAKIVRQFAAAGVAISEADAQTFWDAYCSSMKSGWMTPFSDCVRVLDDLVEDIEMGICDWPLLAALQGRVAPAEKA